jgi:(S)-citramalyl-CoA lyase
MTAPAPAALDSMRSLLFVPADRPERFAKAAASGADAVCIDLEDAVAPAARAAARDGLMQFLATQPAGHPFGVRINRLASADGLLDLLALRNANVAAQFVMLAKTESAVELQLVAAHLGAVPLIALLESAAGLRAAAGIVSDGPPTLCALMFGGADLSAELGCTMVWENLLHARSSLVAAAALGGLLAIDVPWLDVADAEGALAEARRAAALGFGAKALIHPSQVGPVHTGLAPEAVALARARQVLAAAPDGGGAAAVLVDGRLVDRPVVLAAERLLARARR